MGAPPMARQKGRISEQVSGMHPRASDRGMRAGCVGRDPMLGACCGLEKAVSRGM